MLTKQLRSNPEMSTRLTPVLEKITSQTFRASEIVNGLLNFSRTSGTEFISIDLNQLLHDSAILLDHQFKTARIQHRVGPRSRPPRIHGNQGKLQQVILNLMLNAKDAMQGAGDSRLTLSSHANSAATRSSSKSATPAPASRPNTSTASSIPSSPPRPTPRPASTRAPASASPSATASSRSTAARSP